MKTLYSAAIIVLISIVRVEAQGWTELTLGTKFKVQIPENHEVFKKKNPSGTAEQSTYFLDSANFLIKINHVTYPQSYDSMFSKPNEFIEGFFNGNLDASENPEVHYKRKLTIGGLSGQEMSHSYKKRQGADSVQLHFASKVFLADLTLYVFIFAHVESQDPQNLSAETVTAIRTRFFESIVPAQ